MPEQNPGLSPEQVNASGFFSRIRGAIADGAEHVQAGLNHLRENADRLKAVGEIGLVGIGATLGLLAGETISVSAEPVTGSAQASDLREDCIQDALKEPTVIQAKMVHPGSKVQKALQLVQFKAYNGPMEQCDGLIERGSYVRIQKENPYKHLRWNTMQDWNGIDEGNKKFVGGTLVIPNGHEGKWYWYSCTPGPHKTRVRALIRQDAVDPVTHGLAARQIYREPVQIVPKSKAC